MFEFGPFRFYPEQALLLRNGKEVRVGGRALDLLGCLVERAGEVVEKQVLARAVWPTTVVEEVSLRVQVAALRKALGDGEGGARYVVNAAGRGYRFVAPVVCQPGPRMAEHLDARTRELIALVAAVCLRRGGVADTHAQAARRLGVCDEEIAEALSLAGRIGAPTRRAS
jgi:AhpD family alkylhydroperoxidase